MTHLSRRDFIVGSTAVASGGLALGLNLTLGAQVAMAQAAAASDVEVNV